MAFSDDDKKRHLEQITAWVNAATPDPALPSEQKDKYYAKAGGMGKFFDDWETTRRDKIRIKANLDPVNNPAHKKQIDDVIRTEQVELKKNIINTYMDGADKGNSTSVNLTPDQSVNMVKGIIGGDWTGVITGFISQIPIVGDYMVAFGTMTGSWISHMFDKNVPTVGFGQALQNVSDNKHHGGGVQALVSTIGGQNAEGLMADLNKEAPAAAPSASASVPAPKGNGINVANGTLVTPPPTPGNGSPAAGASVG